MPKLTIDYGINLNVKVTKEMHLALQAIGYHRGERGRYAGVVRDLLQAGIDRYMAGLPEGERAKLNEILVTLRAPDTLRK